MYDGLFKGKYCIDAARLTTYDYGSNGCYFVTICTREKLHYFGDIAGQNHEACLVPTPIGQQAIDCWLAIPEHFPFVIPDTFQVMPNHVHGLLWFQKEDDRQWGQNTFGPQRQNLASVIRGYKIGVTKFAASNNIEFGWQARYYERVVRNEEELKHIRQYIIQNPAKWYTDYKNDINLFM
ncbi:transposase [Arsenicibacter rosenii]|uniref:Transposase IS200-like domain-containing protein n=1 Tax=Arsenicibacter rosenii TaxID=1750698 RepID=A0A1S2VJQ2_9BACT|nr:transposase [Arsenicibacter rosenii]OIN58455.1 hypothetical protein BLX24_14515 [Arsenicibacter rosenii]